MSNNITATRYPAVYSGSSVEDIAAAAQAARGVKFGEVVARALSVLGRGIQALGNGLAQARKRRAATAHLSALDDRMLQDIGLRRGEISMAVRSAIQGVEPRFGRYSDAQAINENAKRRAA